MADLLGSFQPTQTINSVGESTSIKRNDGLKGTGR
jgi:hypothetical protein